MKIVVFGLTISSSWGNGHAALWRGLCKALRRKGCRVVFFERNEHTSDHRARELMAALELARACPPVQQAAEA
jgi:spore maturation protein CgeB